MRFQVLGCALALATAFTTTTAQNSTYCPTDKICYTVNVPASGEKDLFFRISGPSSMSWIGLGQGTAMSGANIFIIYADAAGTNVTLSPRLGEGNFEPDSDTSATVTLLDGSMVSNNMMVANVKCSNCQSWSGGTMDFTSTSSDWIYAYQEGSAISSDSVSASISQHDEFGTFNLNLASATGGDGKANPFTTTNTSNTTSDTGSVTPLNGSNNSMSSSGGSSSSGDSKQTAIMSATTAHGIMGAMVFVLLFPSGSIVMRLFHFKGVIWVHVGIQIVSYLLALAVMETGVWVAVNNGQLTKTHPIIGLVTICGLFFQPFLGLGHHLLFRRHQVSPNPFTYPHIWWGRILITLGIINGFLGLQLAGLSMTIKIAYCAVGGTMWTIWISAVILAFVRAKNAAVVKEKLKIVRIKSFDE